MEQVSISQLTSLPAVVAASIFLTDVIKRGLGKKAVISAVPIWVYTALVAGMLTYVANRYGALEGQTGVLVLDGIANGALASGIREWFVTRSKPMSASSAGDGTGRQS